MKNEAKGAKRKPKGAKGKQKTPKGSQKEAKGCKREAKVRQKGDQVASKNGLGRQGRFTGVKKGAARRFPWRFLGPFFLKNHRFSWGK